MHIAAQVLFTARKACSDSVSVVKWFAIREIISGGTLSKSWVEEAGIDASDEACRCSGLSVVSPQAGPLCVSVGESTGSTEMSSTAAILNTDVVVWNVVLKEMVRVR